MGAGTLGVAAHAAVTRASHLRQVGGHRAARRHDARGLRLAAAACAARPVPPDPDGTDPLAARIDALVGLAADAVGLGDAATAARLLDAAAAIGHPAWRLRVRMNWVRAEWALLTGRAGAGVGPAEEALVAAAAAGAVRHVLKSRIVLAVTRAVAGGESAAAVDELDRAAAEAGAAGLLPLVWPALAAAADLEADPNERRAATSPGPARGTPDGATRRRHAALCTVGVVAARCDPDGRRLMGVAAQALGRQSVV